MYCIVLYFNVCYIEFMEEYLTTEQISKLLQVHIITIRRYIHSGKLPALFFGKEFRIKKSDFEEFLAKRKVGK